jgi:hypothetical protein
LSAATQTKSRPTENDGENDDEHDTTTLNPER